MSKILITADVHFDSYPTRTPSKEYRLNQSYLVVEHLLDISKKEGAEYIFILGDLLEKQNRAVQNSKVVGQRIEDIETFRPVKKADPELADVDNNQMLFDAFVGCMARTLGKNNKYVEKFEKEFEPYSIDIIESGKGESKEQAGES